MNWKYHPGFQKRIPASNGQRFRSYREYRFLAGCAERKTARQEKFVYFSQINTQSSLFFNSEVSVSRSQQRGSQ